MSEGPQRRQIKLRSISLATFWALTFCCGLALHSRLNKHELVAMESETQAYLVLGAVLFVSLPAAIGSLLGRALRGALIGFALFVLFVGWIVFALNNWGGT